MSQSKYTQMVEQIRNLPPDAILKAASRCDGHTIFKPEAFTGDGLPEDVVSYVTQTYKSDGSPKGTIFVEGQAVKELKGVYGLDLLRLLASALNVQYQSAMGRGFEAQNIQHALRQHLLKSSPDGPRSG